jgi:hypothetical protein
MPDLLKKHLSFSLLFLLAFVSRLVVLGSNSIAESIIVVGLATLYGFQKYLDQKVAPESDRDLYEEIDILKNTVNAVKLASGFRPNDRPSNHKF